MNDWKPADTAPVKVQVLVFDPSEPYEEAITLATKYADGWHKKYGGKVLYPTHWQEKPFPPDRISVAEPNPYAGLPERLHPTTSR